jgi:hypothetical protein
MIYPRNPRNPRNPRSRHKLAQWNKPLQLQTIACLSRGRIDGGRIFPTATTLGSLE